MTHYRNNHNTPWATTETRRQTGMTPAELRIVLAVLSHEAVFGHSFDCAACGHSDHADLNAAKVLKQRANRSLKPGDGNLLEGSGRTRKEKVKLRAPRRKILKDQCPRKGLESIT